MLKRREFCNTSSKYPLRFWLLAGASSIALIAGVVTVSTRPVQADARLTRPVSTAPTAASAVSATPDLQAPRENPATTTADRLHGIASWYGGVFNGRHTASGERFDMYAMTACHPTLPFGSLVRVVNLDNMHSVVVRITDRGDLFDGRVIDLSYAAAKKLEMLKPGLAPVKLEVLSLGGAHHNK